MRRGLVGFSSPAGYSYNSNWQAHRTKNDISSSPNPVLIGAMGLFTLYDEIWFACESLCPQSMRNLPYVKFVDQELAGLHPEAQGIQRFIEAMSFPGSADLNDMFDGGYGDMPKFVGEGGSTDNHTHSLTFFDMQLSGNLTPHQLAVDIWLLEHLKNLNLELVLNPVTYKMLFPDNHNFRIINLRDYEALILSDSIISLKNIYEYTGQEGPYHPCIEDIRNDDLIFSFRRWLEDGSGRLGNQSAADIQWEIDNRLIELKKTALDKYIGAYSLKNVLVDLLKGKISDAIGIPFSVVEYIGRRSEASEQRAYSFLAKAHLAQEAVLGVRR